MSTADELTKLNELRVKGAISQAEFDRQKASLLDTPKVSKRGSGTGWKVAVGAIGAVGLFIGLAGSFNKGAVALPTCDSPQAKSTLSEAFNRSQFARTLNLSVVEVTNVSQKAFDAQANLRTCAGSVAMNNRDVVQLAYKMQGRPDGQFLLEFEVVSETPASPMQPAPAGVAASPASERSGASSTSSPAPDDWRPPQCVITRGSTSAGTRVFTSPDAPGSSNMLQPGQSLRAVEKRGDWLMLTGAADSAPYEDGAPVGWVRESDVEYIALRNCN